MPGLVPGIHVPPPPRPRPARTAMPQDVDARNKSGHDGEETKVTAGARDAPGEDGEERRVGRVRMRIAATPVPDTGGNGNVWP